MIGFGSALLWVNPNAGNLAANPTPMQPLTVQNFSVDIAVDVKELKGQYQLPDDVAHGDKKVTFKFEFGKPDLDFLNQVLLADTRTTANNNQTQWNEAQSVPASSPYTKTVNNSTAFVKDLGVKYAGNPPAGYPQQFQRVTGTPTQGQYSVSNGTYTFAAADAGAAVLISYVYTATGGFQITANNQLMGYGPQVEIWAANRYQQTAAGSIPGLYLAAAKFSKFSDAMKRDGYEMISAEGTCFQNAAGIWMQRWNPGLA